MGLITGEWTAQPPDTELLTAQCKDGILYVSNPAKNATVGPKYEFNPGGALHAYDLNFFWMNIRANIDVRAKAYLQQAVGAQGS